MGLAIFGWGSGTVSSRGALLEGVEPLTVAALRLIIGAAVVVAYSMAVDRGLPTGRLVWKRGAIMGLLNASLATMLFVTAL